MSRHVERRTVIKAIPAAGVVALPGCSGDNETADDGSSGDDGRVVASDYDGVDLSGNVDSAEGVEVGHNGVKTEEGMIVSAKVLNTGDLIFDLLIEINPVNLDGDSIREAGGRFRFLNVEFGEVVQDTHVALDGQFPSQDIFENFTEYNIDIDVEREGV